MAATEVLEIERKYDLDGPFELPPDGLPGAPVVDGPELDELDAAYFDTADLRLLRGRATLRRRTGGADEGWHLKLPAGAAGERLELRLPLGPDAAVPDAAVPDAAVPDAAVPDAVVPDAAVPDAVVPDVAVPDELVELTLSRTRGAPLAQVARLRTERRRWRLSDGNTVLAEVVSDAVHAELTGDRAGAGVAPGRWHELEVELVDGRRRLLDEWEPRLRELGARPASSASKIGRVLAGALPEPRDTGDSSAGAAVLAYLRSQVEAIVAADPAARRDRPEAVHDMRVAARRARSTLQSFRGILDRERTEPVVAELRWLGTVLAGAREAEVQRARLLPGLRALPPELVPGPAVSRVDSHLAGEHATAHAAAREELRGQRYLSLLDALQDLLDAPPLAGAAAEPAETVLPRLVRRTQRRVRRAYRRYRRAVDGAAADADGGHATPAGRRPDAGQGPDAGQVLGAGAAGGPDMALHDMRKAAKRARYAAEAAAPALGGPAGRSAERLKAVQGTLGDHQDTVVSRDLLRRLGLSAHGRGENALPYGVLVGRDIALAERLRAKLPARWRRADRRQTRRWMS